jgi:ABC-type uncharacterized transport system substrate-binding protein
MKRFALLLPLLLWSLPAGAHPHVMVAVTSEVIFADGKVAGIRHHWTFDDMYSAFVTANLGKNGKDPTTAELQPVAQTNVESLKEFDYFTVPKMNGKKAGFGDAKDYSMTFDGKEKTATLHFTLPLAEAIAPRTFVFQIYDPSYFVAFSFEKGDPVKLLNAPAGCSLSVSKPKALDNEESKKLNESFFSGLSPGSDFGAKLADRAIVACP